MKRLAIALVVTLMSLQLSQVVCAQYYGVHVTATAKEKVLRMAICPAPEPRPALKYRFEPTFDEYTQGNAAVHYGKVTAEQWGVLW